jgi:hypothetical protein
MFQMILTSSRDHVLEGLQPGYPNADIARGVHRGECFTQGLDQSKRTLSLLTCISAEARAEGTRSETQCRRRRSITFTHQ